MLRDSIEYDLLEPARFDTMTQSRSQIDQSRKLLASRATKIRVALASAVALTAGAWLAPRAAPTNLTVSQERAAPLLEQQVQQRDASRPFEGVQEIAGRVMEHSVAILSPVAPRVPSRNDYSEPLTDATRVAGFGVFVSDTHVLTHSLSLDGQSSVELSVRHAPTTRASVVAYEPSSGLALLQTQASGTAVGRVAQEAPKAGALGVAVGRSNERDLALPVFVTSVGGDTYTIGTFSEAVLPGMPVFNLAGEVFALAAPDGREVRAIPIRQATERLMARASAGERTGSVGLGFQSAGGPLSAAFGNDGVVITEVVAGGPGHAADIRVGDVLLAVSDVPIDSAETATRAITAAGSGTPVALRLRRGTRLVGVQVIPAPAYEIAALARASGGPDSGPEARRLFPTAILEAARIPLSAQVLAVNGRALTTRAQVQRELGRARSAVPVLLRHGNNQFFVAVQPTIR